MVERWVNLTHHSLVFTDWLGFHYQLLPGDEIGVYWKRHSVNDAINIVHFILKNITEEWTCIDIGSHIGGVSVPMWSKVGLTGKVISVEADPRNIERIKASLQLNGYPQDYVFNAAITDKKGVVQLRCYEGINGWQTLGNPSFAASYKHFLIEVSAVTFCDLTKNYELESVDLVKVDVEGAELHVLSGMIPFLKDKRIGCVIFEVNHLMLEGFGKTVSELISFWGDFDYDLCRLAPDGSLLELKNEWPNNVIGDCVAFPIRENFKKINGHNDETVKYIGRQSSGDAVVGASP